MIISHEKEKRNSKNRAGECETFIQQCEFQVSRNATAVGQRHSLLENGGAAGKPAKRVYWKRVKSRYESDDAL
jgi:hypothetical protein